MLVIAATTAAAAEATVSCSSHILRQHNRDNRDSRSCRLAAVVPLNPEVGPIKTSNEHNYYSNTNSNINSICSQQHQDRPSNKDNGGCNLTPKELPIVQAKRAAGGFAKIMDGTTAGLTPAYHMVKSVALGCQVYAHRSNLIIANSCK
jgi:hypothetical protein